MKCYQQHKAQQKRHARRIDSRLKSLGYFSMEDFDSNSIHQQEENPPSSAGSGRRFITDRFTAINAAK